MSFRDNFLYLDQAFSNSLGEVPLLELKIPEVPKILDILFMPAEILGSRASRESGRDLSASRSRDWLAFLFLNVDKCLLRMWKRGVVLIILYTLA